MRGWPVGSIKHKWLRRAAFVVVFPFIVLWVFNWRLIVWPLAVLWNALEAAIFGARDSIVADCTTRSMRLIAAGTKAVWNGEYKGNRTTPTTTRKED